MAVPAFIAPFTSRRPLLQRAPPRVCDFHVRLVRCSATPLFAAGTSQSGQVAAAVREAAASASTSLARAGVTASLAFLHVQSSAEEIAPDEMRRVVETARRTLAFRRVLAESTCILGCTSASTAGIDTDPAATVSLLHLPSGATVHPFRVAPDSPLDLDAPQASWWDLVGSPPPGASPASPLQFIMFQHPEYSSPLDLLAGLDFGFPGSAKVGAVAGALSPLHKAYVFDGDGAHAGGVVGVAVSSPALRINVMLAQGARGVGPLLEVTEVKDCTEVTRAREIGTPTEAEAAPMQLLDMWDHTDIITEDDRERARRYLLLGIEVETLADTRAGEPAADRAPAQPEMVVRKVLGFNTATRSLAVEGSAVRLGSRARFQVRDEQSARDELAVLFDRQRLEGVTNAMSDFRLVGAMVMADTERGANLYGDAAPDTDVRLFQERFKVPVAALPCTGQMGPLPAPGFERHFPISGVGFAASTFTHSSAALYVLLYGRFPSEEYVGGEDRNKEEAGS